MAYLNNNNCVVDPNSGAVIFKGSPELRAINNLTNQIRELNIKMDMVLEILKGVVKSGGTLETTRFSKNNDPEV